MPELIGCAAPPGAAVPLDRNSRGILTLLDLVFPKEFKSSKPVIWNSSQYQNINSVLCGYYCLYFLHQWSLGKDFYDILKPLSLVDTSQNEKFIKEYFD